MQSVDAIVQFCLQVVEELYSCHALLPEKTLVRIAYFTISDDAAALDGHTDFPLEDNSPLNRSALIGLRVPVDGLSPTRYHALMYSICRYLPRWPLPPPLPLPLLPAPEFALLFP
jgi:hypothetical protein